MLTIRTQRLSLVAFSSEHLEAELISPASLGEVLRAEVPSDWPPGEHDRDAILFFQKGLEENPEAAGWFGWYALFLPTEGARPVLVGSGGFLGPAGSDGIVEVGYSVLPGFRGQGFATEICGALVDRAFSTDGIKAVVAHTTSANLGSIRVLERSGFRHVGPGTEPGYEAFRRDPRKFPKKIAAE